MDITIACDHVDVNKKMKYYLYLESLALLKAQKHGRPTEECYAVSAIFMTNKARNPYRSRFHMQLLQVQATHSTLAATSQASPWYLVGSLTADSL